MSFFCLINFSVKKEFKTFNFFDLETLHTFFDGSIPKCSNFLKFHGLWKENIKIDSNRVLPPQSQIDPDLLNIMNQKNSQKVGQMSKSQQIEMQ